MEHIRLIFDTRVLELENLHMWDSASKIVYDAWKKNPMDINCLLCAGTELWYTRLMMDYYKGHPNPPGNIEFANEEQLEFMLMDVTRWGLEKFINNATFNAYFGYMIKVMPYFFMDYNGDYSGWQNKGILMMHRSFEIDPNNLLARAMYYEPDDYDKYFESCKNFWNMFSPEQWGKSEVQQYFFRILCGESFYVNAYEERPGKTGDGSLS